ncbi:MAG: XdhC family protein [Chloroflexi bacterium]|nr:XdhC family protein [Chloroflexota bacterium]
MEEIWEQAARLAETGEPALLVTVMTVNGQVPRAAQPGAHLILTADEQIGALDNGPVDSIAIPRLRAALMSGGSVERIGVPAATAHAFGLLHGGVVELLVQPLRDFPAGRLRAVADMVAAGGSALVVTPLMKQGPATFAPGAPALVTSASEVIGMASPIAEALTQGRPLRWESSDGDGFVDIARAADHLVILGATSVAAALCPLALDAGFRVTVVDDTQASSRLAFPATVTVVSGDDPVNALLGLPLGPDAYVVLMSVGHRLDMQVARQVLRRPLRYLGMMGSRGRVSRILATLEEEGFTPEEIARLHAPLGLNIGGETPHEIAVSIAAQLIQVRRGQTGPVSEWAAPAASAAGAAS